MMVGVRSVDKRLTLLIGILLILALSSTATATLFRPVQGGVLDRGTFVGSTGALLGAGQQTPIPLVIELSKFFIRDSTTREIFNISQTGVITSIDLVGTYSNGEAFLCIFDNGTIFVKETSCL